MSRQRSSTHPQSRIWPICCAIWRGRERRSYSPSTGWNEPPELAERVLVLDAGQLVDDGSPETVLANQALLDREIGWPRPALIAARARTQGLWPGTLALPVTLDAPGGGAARK